MKQTTPFLCIFCTVMMNLFANNLCQAQTQLESVNEVIENLYVATSNLGETKRTFRLNQENIGKYNQILFEKDYATANKAYDYALLDTAAAMLELEIEQLETEVQILFEAAGKMTGAERAAFTKVIPMTKENEIWFNAGIAKTK
jgi:hypothetical protein